MASLRNDVLRSARCDLLSIVILTLNSRMFIKNCLDSILIQEQRDFEVIIVDNGSQDGTAALVKKDYPFALMIENEKNLGAAKARNQGIEIAKGEWVVTLDCDVILERNFLHEASRLMKSISYPIGMLQPKILNSDGRRVFSAGIKVSPLIRFYDIGKGNLDGSRFNIQKYVFGSCSAAALYRKDMLVDIKDEWGYFDERLFFLFEDVDLSWRAQDKGWDALFSPSLLCYHHGNSSRVEKNLRQYLCWRNRKLIIGKRKHGRLKLFIIRLCYDFPRLIFMLFTNPMFDRKINLRYEVF